VTNENSGTDLQLCSVWACRPLPRHPALRQTVHLL
jgi:hypothetical protein